jgi:hypothetical protein
MFAIPSLLHYYGSIPGSAHEVGHGNLALTNRRTIGGAKPIASLSSLRPPRRRLSFRLNIRPFTTPSTALYMGSQPSISQTLRQDLFGTAAAELDVSGSMCLLTTPPRLYHRVLEPHK